MEKRCFNVLFLCPGNDAVSIMAESILRAAGGEYFKAFSAGPRPAHQINRFSTLVLERDGYDTSGLEPKHWDKFASETGPQLDFVFTTSDTLVDNTYPKWAGTPIKAHWGINDPTLTDGTDIDKERSFYTALSQMKRRISIFTSLPLLALDAITLQARLHEIGNLG